MMLGADEPRIGLSKAELHLITRRRREVVPFFLKRANTCHPTDLPWRPPERKQVPRAFGAQDDMLAWSFEKRKKEKWKRSLL